MDWKRYEGNVIKRKKLIEEQSRNSSIKLDSNDAREFLCGWGSAVINVTVTYPINKVIFRQVSGLSVNSITSQIQSLKSRDVTAKFDLKLIFLRYSRLCLM